MIGTLQVKVQAATPNLPLQPLFAFKGSPSSLRIMDVPKSIGQWNINEVSVSIKYPDNSSDEKQAVRTGNVWVATVEGCDVTGRVVKGYEVLANGVDEDGNPVVGYVLGSGDVFVLERDSSIPEKDVEKFYVKFCETLPAKPQKGDVVDDGGTVKMYDGTKWIDMGGGSAEEVGDATLTIKKNGVNVGNFTANSFTNKTIDILVPSTTNDLVNDSGFITSAAIPSTVSSFENDVGYLTSVSWGEVQDKPDVALKSEIPSNVSELVNDVGYITASAIPSTISSFENDVGYITASAIPSTVGAFQNDVGYLTSVSWGEVSDKPNVALMSDIPSNVSELENDVGYITASAIPSQVSAFENDVGYLSAVTWNQVENKPDVALVSQIPTTTASLTNDSGYITASAIPSTVSSFENDVGYLTTVSWGDVTNKPNVALQSELPTTTASLVNDSGFITLSAIPSNVGAFTNDVGYITASAIPAIPSKVSELDNDSGFLTSTSTAFTAKRDKTDLSYEYHYDQAEYWNIPRWVVVYDGSTFNLDKYDSEKLEWTDGSSVWSVKVDFAGMDATPYFTLFHQDEGLVPMYPESGAGTTTWDFTYLTESGTVEMDMDGTLTTVNAVEKVVDEKILPKRDYSDITYYATSETYSAYTHGISTFKIATTWDNIGEQTTNAPTVSASTTTWALDDGLGVLTSDGSTFYFQQSGSAVGSSFSMDELKAGAVRRVFDIGGYEGINVTANANFFKTEFALKDALPSKTSDLVNDSGFITASAVPSNVSEFNNDAGYITATAISGKRDYTDLSYNKYDTSDSKYRGVTSWEIRGLKIGSETYNITTSNRGTGHPTYGTYWNDGAAVVYTDNLNTFLFARGGYALTSFTLSLSRFDYTCTWEDSSGVQNVTFHANTDFLARKSELPTNVSELENDVGYITASAIPSNVGEFTNDVGYITSSAIPSNVGAFNNDVGYLTASSSSFTNKRDYDDLTYPGTVYPSQTYRIREFNLGIQGHNPSRYTLNHFDSDNDSRWKDDEEYWNYAVTTSNGEDFAFQKYGESEPVTTFTMDELAAGAVEFTMVESQEEYSCTLNASMYETTIALKDYVDSVVPRNTLTISGIYSDLTSFSYNVYTT